MVGRSIFRMRQSASIDDVESEISLLGKVMLMSEGELLFRFTTIGDELALIIKARQRTLRTYGFFFILVEPLSLSDDLLHMTYLWGLRCPPH